MLKLKLPYPPSINHYWRHVGPRVLISRKGRDYRTAVGAYLKNKNVEPLEGPLVVDIELHLPDRRKRDIDNVLKAVLDALQWGGAFLDDSQIVRLAIEKIEPEKQPIPKGKRKPEPIVGMAEVWIQELEPSNVKEASRTCLKCHEAFPSNGPGNRICNECLALNQEMSPRVDPLWAAKRHNGKAL
ncbi:RusA family crossover junction endodeoxyribonuclease [Stieleria sp. TO1_6]|nr:RusA family crossover junction endodeoxyribonuclease [Stieleria tagensis]